MAEKISHKVDVVVKGLDGRPDELREIALYERPTAPAVPQGEPVAQVTECTRSHPHELMSPECKLRTEIARLTHENERLKRASPAPAVPLGEPVALTVWFGSMPESNGRENWTVMLRRKEKPGTASKRELHHLMSGFTVCRSEYKDRMRYEADRLRFLIGESDNDPDILDYDADLHSGYTAAPSQEPVTLTDEQIIQAMTSEFPTPSLVPMLKGSVICGDFHKALVAAVNVGIAEFCRINGIATMRDKEQAK